MLKRLWPILLFIVGAAVWLSWPSSREVASAQSGYSAHGTRALVPRQTVFTGDGGALWTSPVYSLSGASAVTVYLGFYDGGTTVQSMAPLVVLSDGTAVAPLYNATSVTSTGLMFQIGMNQANCTTWGTPSPTLVCLGIGGALPQGLQFEQQASGSPTPLPPGEGIWLELDGQ